AEPCPNYCGNRRCPSARAEEHRMAPERCRVPIVEIRHGLAELVRKISPDVESRPVPVHKVRRTSCAEYALRARRTRRVEANDYHVGNSNARPYDGQFETVYDLLEANFRSFP